MIKVIKKLKLIAIIQKNRDTEHSICSLKFNVSNEIPVVFHNDSSYNYHFTIKQIWGTN